LAHEARRNGKGRRRHRLAPRRGFPVRYSAVARHRDPRNRTRALCPALFLVTNVNTSSRDA
jgi:hypothetical protein